MVDDGINTSNNNNNNNNPEGEDREINLYAVFFKYMVYWPWFVASVLACCIGMYVFLRYQTPVYNVTSSVLIKEDEKKQIQNFPKMQRKKMKFQNPRKKPERSHNAKEIEP